MKFKLNLSQSIIIFGLRSTKSGGQGQMPRGLVICRGPGWACIAIFMNTISGVALVVSAPGG